MTSSRGYATVDPTDGSVVAEFDTMTDAEVSAALRTAHEAYLDWRRVDVTGRAGLLQRVADLHRRCARELADLMTLEMGKPVTQALAEVELSASIYEYYATKGPHLLEDESLDIAGSGRALVRTAPIGVVLGVMPWNFPYYQVARFVAPNLLLGNAILLKHARNTPQQALRIAALLEEAQAPTGLYTNLFASTEQVADVIADPLLQGVSLTGSDRAGQAVGEVAGRHIKRCVLELGGSDPFVVLEGADLAAAATAAAAGRFSNAGQTCTSSKRFIVQSCVWDEFVTRFLDATSGWRTGDPRDEHTRLGPMSSVAARDDLAAQVRDATERGARVLTGGVVPEGPGAYYPATVLTGVTPDMRAWHEELFGPAAVLHQVDTVDEAIALANDTPYGLGAAVFAGDEASAAFVADRLDVGMVGLNITVKSAPDLPFGGVKSSGFGRELGRFGIDEFANKKLIRIP